MKDLLNIYLKAVKIEDLSFIEMRKNIEDVLYKKEVSLESVMESDDFGQMIGDAVIEISIHTEGLGKCHLDKVVEFPLIEREHKCVPFNQTIDTLFNKDVDKLFNHAKGKGDPMKLINIFNDARRIKDSTIVGMSSYGCKK